MASGRLRLRNLTPRNSYASTFLGQVDPSVSTYDTSSGKRMSLRAKFLLLRMCLHMHMTLHLTIRSLMTLLHSIPSTMSLHSSLGMISIILHTILSSSLLLPKLLRLLQLLRLLKLFIQI
ncbi:hypothetical protein YC2023_061695 [Brassica napus]